MPLALEADDLSFRYPTACDPVLANVTVSLDEGSFALLSGETGAGKSTLLRLLKPELAPEGERAGTLRVLGRDALEGGAAPDEVGLVLQDPDAQLVCDSVWHELAFGLENLGVSQDVMRLRVAEVSHFFGVEGWFRRKVEELSGGQRQLLALAAVLVMRPRLLLLDEPTAMLDPVAEKDFAHALFRVNRELGVTVLVATHRPEVLAPYATRRLRLAEGLVRDEAAREGGTGSPEPRADVRGGCADPADEAVRSGGGGLAPSPDDRGTRASGWVAAPAEKAHPWGRGTGPVRQDAPALELRDLWWRYATDGPWVLRGCSLAVAPGEVHAVCGGNGSGKSTLLALASGVRAPARGSVRHSFSGGVALLPQNPLALFACDRVDDELAEFAALSAHGARDVREVLAEVGLPWDTAFLARHPLDLSGGERQLLALAKLLLTRPGLLLLDEPGKGLDERGRAALVRALRAVVAGGATVLLATHDRSLVAALAHTVSLLFDGQVAASLPADAYLAQTAWL